MYKIKLLYIGTYIYLIILSLMFHKIIINTIIIVFITLYSYLYIFVHNNVFTQLNNEVN